MMKRRVNNWNSLERQITWERGGTHYAACVLHPNNTIARTQAVIQSGYGASRCDMKSEL